MSRLHVAEHEELILSVSKGFQPTFGIHTTLAFVRWHIFIMGTWFYRHVFPPWFPLLVHSREFWLESIYTNIF